jgi:hypothetical protein
MLKPLFRNVSDEEYPSANRTHITLSEPRRESVESRNGQLQEKMPYHFRPQVKTTHTTMEFEVARRCIVEDEACGTRR